MAKILIAYYSRRGQNYWNGSIKNLAKGNTEVVAEMIQKAVGGDLFEIETVKEYPVDYTECTEVAKEELRAKARPELKKMPESIDAYDVIFLGYPCKNRAFLYSRRQPHGRQREPYQKDGPRRFGTGRPSRSRGGSGRSRRRGRGLGKKVPVSGSGRGRIHKTNAASGVKVKINSAENGRTLHCFCYAFLL